MKTAIRFVAVAFLAMSLGACAQIQKLENAVTVATGTTIPASAVIPAANAFDILKATATNYGRYCIAEQMAPAICSADNRRAVIKFVRSGTAARNQAEASLGTGQPVLASVYNLLIAAVAGLKTTPVASFGG